MALDLQGALEVFNPLGEVSVDGKSMNGMITDQTGNVKLSDLDPTKSAQVADFNAPELKAGTAYGGTFDPSKGGSQLQGLESQLGIQAFNPNAYKSELNAGLRANVDEGVRAERSTVGNRMGRSGFLNSGTAEALDRESIGRGERSYAMGAAANAQDAAGKQLAENNNRLGMASNFAGQNLQNSQFGATFGEGQRNQDNLNTYGSALDQYQLNELDPAMRKDAMRAGMLQAGASLVGSGISAAGSAAGKAGTAAAIACRIAEATFGVDHPLTNKARYRVNVQWPEGAKQFYIKHMDRVSAVIRRHPSAKLIAKPIFWLIGLGAKQMHANGEVI